MTDKNPNRVRGATVAWKRLRTKREILALLDKASQQFSTISKAGNRNAQLLALDKVRNSLVDTERLARSRNIGPGRLELLQRIASMQAIVQQRGMIITARKGPKA